MKHAIILAFLALSACSPKVVTRDAPVTVKVPVPSKCVTEWPLKPDPLPDGSHWAGLDVKQKAATIGAQAIELKNYAGNLEAATSACK